MINKLINIMIKNYLSFSRRFIFTLFTVLMSANLWGQELIDLANCTIEGVDTYYHHTGSAYTITPVVKDGGTTVDPANYNVSYTYNGAAYTGSFIDKGLYVLTISGKESYSTGAITKAFSIYGELEGEGTELSPWQISSAADWEEFANHPGYWDNDDYVVMTSNVPNAAEVAAGITSVSTIVGLWDDYNSYSGEFDGAGKVLVFNYDGSYSCAPFYYTSGATIKDLKVEGNIDAYSGSAAGLIYSNDDLTTIQDVTVNVGISSDGQNYCGGFSSYSKNFHFIRCVYNGRIVAGGHSGGFCGTEDTDENVTFTDCVFAPAEGSAIESGYTFGLGTIGSDCYYTNNLGTTEQGEKAYLTSVPSGNIGKYEKQIQGFNVYKDVAVVHNVKDAYAYTGSAITITPEVSFDGVDAIANEYCTAEISPSPVQAVGTYTLTITPDNTKGYYGSYTKTFKVAKLNGDGSSEHPYEIASTDDWNCLAVYVNDNGESFSGKYVHLTNDITVSTMVGTPEHPFSGDFSGLKGQYAANTLTFNYGSSANPTEEEIVAPFRYTDGATIHSLIVDGAIYTNVGKESGLIGVNTRTSTNTTVQFVINRVNFICYEDLLDAEGGGYAYDGSGISFIYSSYEGTISANNYHGGFCGNANASTTSFSNCLFNPTESGFYWAQNFIFNTTGNLPNNYYSTCYYTVGHNQEESEQGTMVFVNTVPVGNIGHKLTTFHEKVVYKPVEVVITGVKKRYTYTGNPITVAPTAVTFDGNDALDEGNELCTWSITPSLVQAVGSYTFTLTAPNPSVTSDYLGTINQIVRVVDPSSPGWAALQVQLSGSEATINLNDLTNENIITAGDNDACLVVESGRNVTINLNGKTIDRGFFEGEGHWRTPVVGGQVLKIASGATVIIKGPGKIMGGCNKASSTNEHAENSDGGGIFNMGTLTLDDVTIEGNYCEKKTAGVSRTARGGGIYSGSGSKLYINNCTITHNEAKGGGGGLFVEKAAVFEMKHTSVRSNKSQDKGGGVRLNADGTQHNNGSKALVSGALIDDCVIENNTVELYNKDSASNGGGIHLDAGILDLTECTVDQNYASKFGGGIYMMGGTINASGCSISFNRSFNEKNLFEGCGGGVCVLGGTFKMIGGTITGNSSYISDGGGIYVATGKTLKLEGGVSVYGNWTYNDATITTQHTTNVYLAGTNDKINISGSIAGASVGVSKAGVTGQFTTNLQGKGTVANFTSDNGDYQILPITVNNKQEAKIGTPAEWNDPTPVNNQIVISEPTTINTTVTESYDYTIVFTGDGCLIIGPNGVLTAKISNNDPLKLIIEDGGQVITNTTVAARVKKEVEKFAPVAYDYWYLISSPVNNPAIATATNIVVLNPEMVLPTPGYDLYRFNEAATATNGQGQILHWENYRNEAYHGGSSENPFDNMTNGRGYLYRSCQDYTVTIDGNLNVGAVNSYTLTNKGTNDFKGFNLIGNPYSHNIKKGDGQAIPNTYLEGKYYVLNPTGCQWVLTDDGAVIPPLTGVLVQANSSVTTSGQSLAISDVAISSSKGGRYEKANNTNIWFTVANNKYEDKACVEFKEGRGLNKIAHMNEEVPMIYIRHNDEDFASVDMNPATTSFDLNFEAMTTGYYTLSVNPQGEYKYLHLYDKLTGEDVDLLSEDKYSFIGSPSDNADRFVVRLENSENAENSVFAYQSGNEIIVSGEGELQVFDVMGRLVARQYVSGVVTWRTASLPMGVYIFRLNDKSQKIVIR